MLLLDPVQLAAVEMAAAFVVCLVALLVAGLAVWRLSQRGPDVDAIRRDAYADGYMLGAADRQRARRSED